MLAGLTLLAFVLLVLSVAILRDRLTLGDSVREALLVAAALWGGFVVACTELLSLGAWFRFGPVLACWLGLDLLLLGWVFAQRRRLRGWLRTTFGSYRVVDWLLLALCVLLVAGTGLCAVLAPPNNCDSLVYHLPRQIRWIQQGSVAHFPCECDRQLCFPPYAEFAGAHLMLLAGDDRWADLVQWSALVLTMAAVSLLARDLGQGRTGQLLSALFVVTVPMAYLQAFNTKNDLVVSFWLCSAAWWGLRIWNGRPLAGIPAAIFGLTFGLLLLTKSTGYLFAVPVAAVIGLGLLLRQRARWLPASLIAAIVLLMNAGHWGRNILVFHSPFGPVESQKGHNNETFAPAALASNLIRNVALHLGVPSARWNTALTREIETWHEWLGIDARDPRTSFVPSFCRFEVVYAPENEDQAPAPAHVVLVLLVTAVLPLWLVWGRLGIPAQVYLILPYGSFVIFCLILKWQPWHPRLQLPVFCLFAVVLACFCMGRSRRWLAVLAVAGCLAALAPSVYLCHTKTLFTEASVFHQDRQTLRFMDRSQWKGPTQRMAARVAQLQPRTVGLLHFASQCEYLLERLVLDEMRRHEPAFLPCYTSGQKMWSDSPECRRQAPDVVVGFEQRGRLVRQPYSGETFAAVAQDGPYTLYLPVARLPDPTRASDSCPFIGWEAGKGWLDFQGPFPEHQLGIVRWALEPACEFHVEGDGQPVRLIAECIPNEIGGQGFVVRVNGQVTHRYECPAPNRFAALDIRLPTQMGDNVVALELLHLSSGPEPRRAVLFKKLQIVPVAPDPRGN